MPDGRHGWRMGGGVAVGGVGDLACWPAPVDGLARAEVEVG